MTKIQKIISSNSNVQSLIKWKQKASFKGGFLLF